MVLCGRRDVLGEFLAQGALRGVLLALHEALQHHADRCVGIGVGDLVAQTHAGMRFGHPHDALNVTHGNRDAVVFLSGLAQIGVQLRDLLGVEVVELRLAAAGVHDVPATRPPCELAAHHTHAHAHTQARTS